MYGAVLDTSRLNLRPCELNDLEPLHSLWTEPGVRRFLLDDRLISQSDAEAYIRFSLDCFANHGFGFWVFGLKRESAILGFCGFRIIEEAAEPELLYGLTEQHWGRGLAAEAASAIVNFGFAARGLKRVIAVADTANQSSISVMKRIGLLYDGREITPEFDRTSYSITQETWRERTLQGPAPNLEERSEAVGVFEGQHNAVYEPAVEIQPLSQE